MIEEIPERMELLDKFKRTQRSGIRLEITVVALTIREAVVFDRNTVDLREDTRNLEMRHVPWTDYRRHVDYLLELIRKNNTLQSQDSFFTATNSVCNSTGCP